MTTLFDITFGIVSTVDGKTVYTKVEQADAKIANHVVLVPQTEIDVDEKREIVNAYKARGWRETENSSKSSIKLVRSVPSLKAVDATSVLDMLG